MTDSSTSAIACNLGALTAAERERRSELATRIRSLAREVVELDDGYALRLLPEPSLAREAWEWLVLESRCCPFLHLEVALEADQGPLWVRLRGTPTVKRFLAEAGLRSVAPASPG